MPKPVEWEMRVRCGLIAQGIPYDIASVIAMAVRRDQAGERIITTRSAFHLRPFVVPGWFLFAVSGAAIALSLVALVMLWVWL